MTRVLPLALLCALALGTETAWAEDVGESIDMTMSSGAPTQYFFRGLPQGTKGFIWQANANLDVALYDSEALQVLLPVGFWLSLHPGDQAERGRGPAAWYESRMTGGLAVAGKAFRTDARFAVYSSPNGSFRDVYELLVTAEIRDDSFWASDAAALFRGFFPSVTLAHELDGARDGMGEGTFAELRIAPRVRLLATADWQIDVALPVAFGLSLRDYYQLPARTSTKDHAIGYVSASAAIDLQPLFVPNRLGLYTIRPSLELLLPTAASDSALDADTMEVIAQIESFLRF